MNDIQTIFQEYLDSHIDEADLNFVPLLHQYPQHKDSLTKKINAYKRIAALMRDNTSPDEDAPQLIGREFGGCRLVRILGQGGMGVVYLGYQEKLNRGVVVKVLRPFAVDNKALKERFLRESRTIGRLNHKNIVPVYDVGEQGESFYIIMRHIEGMPLNVFIEKFSKTERSPAAVRDVLGIETKSTTEFLCNIIIRVADAVQYAHDNGVIHRDIKPSNIIIEPNGNPVLLDFGLSHDDVENNLTMTGDFLGTPIYSAPELFQKDAPKDGAQLDVYALGVTLFELLTGGLPYRGDSIYEIYNNIKNKDPIKPKTLWKQVPRDLETIVLTAIAKEPRFRYQAIKLLQDDIDKFLEYKPIEARAPSLVKRSFYYLRRQRRIATFVMTITVLLAVIFMGVHLKQKYNLRSMLTSAIMDGDVDSKINKLEYLVTQFPKNKQLWTLLGGAQAQSGNYKEAISDYEKGVVSSGTLLALISIYLARNDINSAEGTLNKLQISYPDSEDTINAEYRVNLFKGDLENALLCLKKSKLKDSDSFYQLSLLNKWLGHNNIAKTNLQNAILGSPYDRRLYKLLELFPLTTDQRKYLNKVESLFGHQQLSVDDHDIKVTVPFGWQPISYRQFGKEVFAAYSAVPSSPQHLDGFHYRSALQVACLGHQVNPVEAAKQFMNDVARRFGGAVSTNEVVDAKNGSIILSDASFASGPIKIAALVAVNDEKTYVVAGYAPKGEFSFHTSDIMAALDIVSFSKDKSAVYQPTYKSYEVWMPRTPLYSQVNTDKLTTHVLASSDLKSRDPQRYFVYHWLTYGVKTDNMILEGLQKIKGILASSGKTLLSKEYSKDGRRYLRLKVLINGTAQAKNIGVDAVDADYPDLISDILIFYTDSGIFQLEVDQDSNAYGEEKVDRFFNSFQYFGPPLAIENNMLFETRRNSKVKQIYIENISNKQRIAADNKSEQAKKIYLNNNATEAELASAFRLFNDAAELGSVNAMNNVGVMYQRGRGVQSSIIDAEYWFAKAASYPLTVAQHNLGVLYLSSAKSFMGELLSLPLKKQLEENSHKAQKWLELAAAGGDHDAAHTLGKIYEDGIPGLEPNYTKADYWYGKSFE